MWFVATISASPRTPRCNIINQFFLELLCSLDTVIIHFGNSWDGFLDLPLYLSVAAHYSNFGGGETAHADSIQLSYFSLRETWNDLTERSKCGSGYLQLKPQFWPRSGPLFGPTSCSPSPVWRNHNLRRWQIYFFYSSQEKKHKSTPQFLFFF